ncbi:MAG TPA: hypothetical protein P5511_01095 [Candidatus Goldiibacteriota bacterium]|nr:hypothetical protein [Candidatus Goldiibacteriota bacterium]
MKKIVVFAVLALLCALPVTAFFDDLIKEAVGGAVNEAIKEGAKKAKIEAVKSMDDELREVLEQVPVEKSPEEIEGKSRRYLTRSWAEISRKLPGQ